jgi:hypothetical protein
LSAHINQYGFPVDPIRKKAVAPFRIPDKNGTGPAGSPSPCNRGTGPGGQNGAWFPDDIPILSGNGLLPCFLDSVLQLAVLYEWPYRNSGSFIAFGDFLVKMVPDFFHATAVNPEVVISQAGGGSKMDALIIGIEEKLYVIGETKNGGLKFSMEIMACFFNNLTVLIIIHDLREPVKGHTFISAECQGRQVPVGIIRLGRYASR